MNLAFSGTRRGMTYEQRIAFGSLVARLWPDLFRHGSCQGADVEAAEIVRAVMGADRVRIVCHPGPVHDIFRASSGVDDEVLPGKTHFARNRDIVDGSDALVACPPSKPMPERGGTRYTHDYAVKKGKPVYVIWPDGTVEDPKPC